MLTEQAYWDEVERLAKAITREARDEEREISEVLHETIDSHAYVIYTAQSQRILAYSPNDGAYIESHGAEGVVSGNSLNWGVLAYGALEADVCEHSDFGAEPEDDEEDEEA